MRTSKSPFAAAVAALPLLAVEAGPCVAEHVYHLDDDEVTAEAMAADALVVRPVGIAATLVGSVIYALSLPFSCSGGNQPQAREALVEDPARFTFQRPLGDDF